MPRLCLPPAELSLFVPGNCRALRNAELAATERHLDRLREGRPESIETTSLHLDVLRDLRRIHSHICSVAYPVLDAAGELPEHRKAESGAVMPHDRAAFAAPAEISCWRRTAVR